MKSKIVTTEEEFYSLQSHWERLQEQDPDVTYYSTFEFIKTWWETYKHEGNKKLFIICVYHDSKILGIAPLMIEERKKNKIKYNMLKFLGRGDYLGVVLDRLNNEIDIIKSMFKTIEKFGDEFQRIQLTHIKHDSMLAYYLLRNGAYNKWFTYLVECPQIYITKINNFQEYKKKYVPSSAKKHSNRLAREQNYKFKIISNNNDDIYERISELHIKEQKYLVNIKNRKDRRSLFEDKFYSQFVKCLYKENSNIVTFVITCNEDKLIMYETCYFYKGILHCWNTAYDPQYEKYNLGRVMNYEILNYMLDSNMAEVFDFGAGRYPWKFEWTKDFIFDYQLDMWNMKNKKGDFLKKLSCIKKFCKKK